MSRKSIFTVAGGAALGLLFAAGILWVELLAAEAEYVEEQEPVSPPVAEVIRQETPQEAAYTNESTMTVTAYCPCEKCCGAYSNGYMHDYLHAQKGYGWHISDLRIYDAPRELSGFTGLRNTRFGAAPYDIKRAPQSWCYVEEG